MGRVPPPRAPSTMGRDARPRFYITRDRVSPYAWRVTGAGGEIDDFPWANAAQAAKAAIDSIAPGAGAVIFIEEERS